MTLSPIPRQPQHLPRVFYASRASVTEKLQQQSSPSVCVHRYVIRLPDNASPPGDICRRADLSKLYAGHTSS